MELNHIYLLDILGMILKIMFDQILSLANLEEAYLEIIKEFSADHRNFKYHGLDNIFLKDLELRSQEIISQIRSELGSFKELEPALSVKIPKKNKPGEFREIFVYNIKERIKAQAIYRVVLPEFEKRYSKNLFSYRPGKPPHLAAKFFCQEYRRYFNNYGALIIDLKNYSDRVSRELMFLKLKDLFNDERVLNILALFIFNKVYRGNQLESPQRGLIQGVPLIALFVNLYLTEFDFKYQDQVNFYVRVGDDITFLDRDSKKLEKFSTEIFSDLDNLNLEVNQSKKFLGLASEEFSYLGYHFNNGIISLEPNFVKRIETEWKRVLAYKHYSLGAKLNILKKIMAREKTNFNNVFYLMVKSKPQINDSEQIKKISESFFKMLTKFFYEKYSPRNRKKLKELIEPFRINSLYKIYQKFHYEKR